MQKLKTKKAKELYNEIKKNEPKGLLYLSIPKEIKTEDSALIYEQIKQEKGFFRLSLLGVFKGYLGVNPNILWMDQWLTMGALSLHMLSQQKELIEKVHGDANVSDNKKSWWVYEDRELTEHWQQMSSKSDQQVYMVLGSSWELWVNQWPEFKDHQMDEQSLLKIKELMHSWFTMVIEKALALEKNPVKNPWQSNKNTCDVSGLVEELIQDQLVDKKGILIEQPQGIAQKISDYLKYKVGPFN